MRDFIEKARASLEMDPPDFKRAMVHLLKVIEQCQSCTDKGRHGKDKECHIIQCTKIFRSNDSGEWRDIINRPCPCGYIWPQCSSPNHIEVLDLLADAQQQGQQWISSLATAMGLIRLNPTCAAGYCRVALILFALEKEHKTATSDSKIAITVESLLSYFEFTKPERLRLLAAKFVNVGLRMAVAETTPSSTINYHRVLQLMGHRIGAPESKRDPAKVLPLELYVAIFKYLDPTARSRCLRVNRNWHGLIMGSKSLWACLDIPKPGRVADSAFVLFLKRRPIIETLVFRDMSNMGPITHKKLVTILSTPSLRRLVLPTSRFDPDCIVRSVDLPSKLHLTQLCIANITFDFLHCILYHTQKTLQILQLPACSHSLDELMANLSMPNLRGLAITGSRVVTTIRGNPTPVLPLAITPIAVASPNLEELFIDSFDVYSCEHPGQPQLVNGPGDIEQCWKKLRAITLGPNVRTGRGGIFVARGFPPPTEQMERIDIMSTDATVIHNYLYTVKVGDQYQHAIQDQEFQGILPVMPNLHTFRCRAAVRASLLREILEPALSKLRVLELSVLPHGSVSRSLAGFFPGPLGIGRVDEVLSWLYAENLEHVGLHDFNYCPDRSAQVGPRFDGKPFTKWIENNLPNVTSVAVYPGAQPDSNTYIGSLIAHPRKFRVIWQNSLSGMALDMGLDLARCQGVQLRHWPKGVPAGPDWEQIILKDDWRDAAFKSLWKFDDPKSRYFSVVDDNDSTS
ncbi:hypothetical protein QBC38DRAFT_441091 [Podospora fimiseda]|uniref:F-box domain-containing protein n=1 Tax=Podospora fimiseda TaxID=252190 RepID=A0AAN7BVH9_9PEZI|nr:hypothetical protein QBC38DRAFT_441091 [Podospora fimiseda]